MPPASPLHPLTQKSEKTTTACENAASPLHPPLHPPCIPPVHKVTSENCIPPASPLHPPYIPPVCTPPPYPPTDASTPKGGDAHPEKVVEGLTFLLKQYGFDATVSVRQSPRSDYALCSFGMPDAACLSTDAFTALLSSIHSVDELNGLANRRRHLRNPDLQRWSEQQRQAIIHRKYQLEQEQKNDNQYRSNFNTYNTASTR